MRWFTKATVIPELDTEDYPEGQRFPRQFCLDFREVGIGVIPQVEVTPGGSIAHRWNGQGVIDDNAYVPDGYRYHDVIHLGHATVLHWSPVMRSMLGAKRKDDPGTDRVEDGARAIGIEEGIASFAFEYLKERQTYLRVCKRQALLYPITAAKRLEVNVMPAGAWASAYLQAFRVMSELIESGGGRVVCDLDERELRVQPLPAVRQDPA